MALKDLIASLQQAATQTEARRSLSENALASSVPPAPVGNPAGAGRRAGRSEGPFSGGSKSGNGKLDAFLKAISAQESGGNYSAIGVPTKYGTAYGKYQILDSNIKGPGGWDKEALGRDITVQQFLKRPKLQERIAQSKLSNYFNQYGASGAAKAWYAGPGNADSNSDSPQYGGPSINDYAASVLKRMRGFL